MAEVQLYRYQFLTSSGGFNAGDTVDIFIETDDAVAPAMALNFEDAGIFVKVNDVTTPIGSLPGSPYAPFISLTENVDYQLVNYNAQICVGTSLLVFNTGWFAWPSVYYYSQENHYSCAINPPTCNLIVVGIPTVTPATDATTTDGAVTVVASSSNPYKFKIGSDFTYEDGTGQTSGVFNGLLAGSYRVFLRDSANCGANVQVVIPVNNTYSPIYRLEYTDYEDQLTRIDVTKRGYAGSVTEVCGDGDPFLLSLRGEGSDDKFEALLATQATLKLMSDIDFRFAEIYTNDPNLYRINYYKFDALELQGVYKILPQQYQEEFKAPPYFVTVVATDGLPELKDFYLIQDSGQKYYGTVKLIKLVAHILGVLKLDLPIRVACNLYAVNMAQTATDDPFDQAYCDFQAFYLAQEQPTLDFVLRSILDVFGARIVQAQGRWNIVRVEETTSTYDYRYFDKDGNYTANGSFNPVLDVDHPSNAGDLMFMNADANLEIRPGYGTMKVLYNLGLKPNILENGDFRLAGRYVPPGPSWAGGFVFDLVKDGWTLVNVGYPLYEDVEYISENNIAYKISTGQEIQNYTQGGEAYLQSAAYFVKLGTNNQVKIAIRCKVTKKTAIYGNAVYTIDVPYVKVRIQVRYGSLYLQSNGTWSTSANKLTFFLTEWDKYTDFEIVAYQPGFGLGTPTSGMDFDVRVYHAYHYHVDFLSLPELKAMPTYDSGASEQLIPNGHKTQLRDDFTGPSFMYFFELEETTDPENLIDYSLIEPDDYHPIDNPRKWVKKLRLFVGGVLVGGQDYASFFIDKVVVSFLTDGKDPINAIQRSTNGEPNNKMVFDKELILGSYSNLIVTESGVGFSIGGFIGGGSSFNIITRSILSAELIYTGYLRASDGEGYEFWARDGVAESDKLHGITLRSVSKQYKGSWELLRTSLYAKTYMTFLHSIRNVNYDDKIYLPMGIEFNDKKCMYSGEFLEINYDNDDSTGGGSSPFSSAFSIGHGSGGFN